MAKLKVLDLFAGTQSVKKALSAMFKIHTWVYQDGVWYGYTLGNPLAFIEYIGLDIYSPEGNNLIIDLAQDNIIDKLSYELPNLWKPDIIWASPICNSFSIVLSGKGGNYYYEVDKENKTIKVREDWNIKVQPHMKKYQNEEGHKKAKKQATLHLKLHKNTKKIIDHYNVPFAIENPATALTRYIYKDFERNVAHYCMYKFDYKKPTAIYSNKQLNLLKCDNTHTHH